MKTSLLPPGAKRSDSFTRRLVRYRYRDLLSLGLSGLFWSRSKDCAEPSCTQLLKNPQCADRTLTLPRAQTAATPRRTAQSVPSECRSTNHVPAAAPPPLRALLPAATSGSATAPQHSLESATPVPRSPHPLDSTAADAQTPPPRGSASARPWAAPPAPCDQGPPSRPRSPSVRTRSRPSPSARLPHTQSWPCNRPHLES